MFASEDRTVHESLHESPVCRTLTMLVNCEILWVLLLLLFFLLYWICFSFCIFFGAICAFVIVRLCHNPQEQVNVRTAQESEFSIISINDVPKEIVLNVQCRNAETTKKNKNNNEIDTILLSLTVVLLLLFAILLYWLCFSCGIGNFLPFLVIDTMSFIIIICLLIKRYICPLSTATTLPNVTTEAIAEEGGEAEENDKEKEKEKENWLQIKIDDQFAQEKKNKDKTCDNENSGNNLHYYSIIGYEFGSMESIDGMIICQYFSLKDVLRYQLVNKYFNNLINDRLNDIIWYDICNALQVLPMKMTEKMHIVNDNNNRNIGVDGRVSENTKASEIFWHSCKDNGVEIDSLLKILEKNHLFINKSDGSRDNQKREKNNFLNKLNDTCCHFLKRWENIKTTDTNTNTKTNANGNTNASTECDKNLMFKRKKIDYQNWFDRQEMNEKLERLKQIKCDKSQSFKTTHSIVKFSQLIDNIVCKVNKYNKQLWTNETNFYIYYPKVKELYDDLFDIFYYFGWYLGNEEKNTYNKNDACYFYESIFIWITIRFMDQLPITPQFIGDFGDVNKPLGYGKYRDENRCHTDWGNVSFIEFFITFKTHMTMQYPFFKGDNYTFKMGKIENENVFEEIFPAYFYDSLRFSDNWFDYIGFWRINFLLSMYFLSNDKHLGKRNHLIQVMLTFGVSRSALERVVWNRMYYNFVDNDNTLNRLQFMFLYDARPFAPLRSPFGDDSTIVAQGDLSLIKKPVHFNPWTWISLFEKENHDDTDSKKKLAIVASGHEKNINFVGHPSDRTLSEKESFDLMRQFIAKKCFNRYGIDYCRKSYNYKYENLDNPKFGKKVKQMMQLIREYND